MNLIDRLRLAVASETAGHFLLPHRALWHLWRRRRPAPALSEVRSILVVRLDEIGDLVLASSFLRELRRSAPQAHITIVVKPVGRELLAACPHVDAVETFAGPDLPWGPARSARLRRMILRRQFFRQFAQPFDLVLLPRRDPDYVGGEYFGYAAGFGYVAALEDWGVPANRDGRYYRSYCERLVPVNSIEHEADYALALLPALGGTVTDRQLEIWTTPADRAAADAFIGQHFAGQPFAVMHPTGGRSVLKQWPIERFVAVAEQLTQSDGLSWLIIGGSEETWISRSFFESPRVVCAPGKLPLRTLAAILARARLFVGGDSGPSHLAAAAGTPMVAVFGSTSLTRFAPRGPYVRVVSLELECSPDRQGTYVDRCKSCIHRTPLCLHNLPASRVVDAAQQLLRLAASSSARP